MTKRFLLMICLIWNVGLYGQTVSGSFKYHSGSVLKLVGYNGFDRVQLGTTVADSMGNFLIKYPADYYGIAYLEADQNAQIFLVLNETDVKLIGTHLQVPDSTFFINSRENEIFYEYSWQHHQREAALAGWKYLKPQYEKAKILSGQTSALTEIENEIQRLEKEDAGYLNKLDPSTYVSWFLPIRKLLDDMPVAAQRHMERIPKHIQDFRSMNFKDERWMHSGILDDIIEGHYWLLENSGKPLDSVFMEMDVSTDYLIDTIIEDEVLLNQVSKFIFHLLERRSLFKSSEHLALKLLTRDACLIDDNFSKQLESYRNMRNNVVTPDIVFYGNKSILGTKLKGQMSLSDLGYNTVLLFFGSSECPRCLEDLAQIKGLYSNWLERGLQVIFISLDTEENKFDDFTKNFPWLSYCDLGGWESQPIKDYFVFATPTMYLLDKDRKILVKPGSVEQVDAWVEYKL